MEIAVETSARLGDVIRLGPEQRANGRFEFQHHKNGVDVSFPVSAELQAAIDAMPSTNQATFLHTKAGNVRVWICALMLLLSSGARLAATSSRERGVRPRMVGTARL
jgi:hypothetical protein